MIRGTEAVPPPLSPPPAAPSPAGRIRWRRREEKMVSAPGGGGGLMEGVPVPSTPISAPLDVFYSYFSPHISPFLYPEISFAPVYFTRSPFCLHFSAQISLLIPISQPSVFICPYFSPHITHLSLLFCPDPPFGPYFSLYVSHLSLFRTPNKSLSAFLSP